MAGIDADDETEVWRLDSAWNAAYERNDRAPLAEILADDFAAVLPTGDLIPKSALQVDPAPPKAVAFSERSLRMFGDAAICLGRLQLDLTDRKVDQRYMRVYAKRDGRWRAVAVSAWAVPA